MRRRLLPFDSRALPQLNRKGAGGAGEAGGAGGAGEAGEAGGAGEAGEEKLGSCSAFKP
ncbi:hypothetical protein [Coleofasciculus sp.]|uniref:hypothetical protein n=1 Tax=Coleofasciculus sp. TaxID=3100458 RepID=UPI0039F8D99B